ncbi:AAA family ATPase [Streptomyces caniferus]|uniref:AAA family ATPase n=1 Tax=Streptomyces caniferus TaxID=285557 RepID=UPI0039A46383
MRRLDVKNFRSCYDIKVEFRPGITLLVGENNSGKSNVIEALRMATTPLNRRATRWFDESDPSHGREAERSQFRAMYDGLSAAQRAHYIAALDVETSQAAYTTTYRRDEARQQMRPTVTAGPVDGPDAEPDKRDQIAHVYLARCEMPSGSWTPPTGTGCCGSSVTSPRKPSKRRSALRLTNRSPSSRITPS